MNTQRTLEEFEKQFVCDTSVHFLNKNAECCHHMTSDLYQKEVKDFLENALEEAYTQGYRDSKNVTVTYKRDK